MLDPSGLTVEASTSGKETRLACTVTGTTLSLADVTPQDSTFYEVNAQYGWKKEVKYKNFEYPKSAIVSGTSGLAVNGVDASGQLHDLSAQTMLVTTTPRTLIEWHKGSNRKPVGIHLDFIDSDYFKWLDARFTLVLPTETVNKYAAVKITLKNKKSAPVEQVWKPPYRHPLSGGVFHAPTRARVRHFSFFAFTSSPTCVNALTVSA